MEFDGNGQAKFGGSKSQYLAPDASSNEQAGSKGKTVLPYVPMIPPLQNPKKLHRYVASVWEQPKDFGSVVEQLKSNWLQKAAEKRKAALQLEPHQKIHESDGELAMNFRERFEVGPASKFAKENGLSLVGYGFYTSTFNVDTPQLMSDLGISFSL